MIPGSEIARIEVSGDTLRVSGDLGLDEHLAFVMALEELMATEHTGLNIDLTDVHYINSIYVSAIALAIVQVKKQGRSLSVRAATRVSRILSLGGVEVLGSVETVG